ncbi:telomere zinc finger-associated protein [Aplochiton taeniatus]
MLAKGSVHAQHVLSSLNQQRALRQFCDAVLSVESGEEVCYAHRNILACFCELFQSKTETPARSCMEVYLEHCPLDGLKLLLDFFYTGELKLDPLNLGNVQLAAVCLGVPEALTLCQQFEEGPQEPAQIVKRKRGRPRKSKTITLTSSVARNEEAATATVTALDPSLLDSASDVFSTTTTRSGRKVKGPRRLLGESPPEELSPYGKVKRSPLEREISVTPGERDGAKAAKEAPSLLQDLSEQEVERLDFYSASCDSPSSFLALWHATQTATLRPRRKPGGKEMKKENGEQMEDNSKKGSVQCPICDKTFCSKYYLKVHNRRHTGEKPFVCAKCGKRYYRKENLIEHQTRNCSRVLVFSCPTCPLTFTKKQEIRLHIISHTGDMPNKCSTCPEQFMHKRELTIHQIKAHGFPKPHACSLCTKCFLSRTELRVHEASKHRGEKPFVCEECGHRASSRNGLQMHIKAIHRNERPFVCSYCNHAFTQKANLNMHLRVHTGEKPYQCHLCGKTFRTQASLDKHHRTHTGERPFSCEFCQQRFTEKGPLLRHVASKHQEGRPHCCNICGKTFKAIEQLRVHVRRHKGMRKFECSDCGYKFTRQAHLRRHVQIHKRTENYNPRQRKLRNLIVEEDGQSDAEVPEEAIGETLATSGVTLVTGGVTLATGGVTLATGGQTVATGGVTLVTGGVTLATGGVTLATGGQTVATGGVTVATGGVTLATGGETLATGGVTLATGGVTLATGGLTLATDGVTLATGGQTLEAGGEASMLAPGNVSISGLEQRDIVRVVIQPEGLHTEETVETFTVSDVIEQTQLVTGGYESTVVVEEMVDASKKT